MREIKFRAYNKSAKKYTYFDKEPKLELSNELDLGIFIKASNWVYITEYEEPQQYVGLKDKNGKEIYEGDIIQFTWTSDSCWGKAGTYIAYIRFDSGDFEAVYIGKVREKRIRENTECFDNLKSFMDWSEEVKVIGNIYERPELLKEGQV